MSATLQIRPPDAPPPPRHRRRRRRPGRWIALCVAVLLAWPVLSYARALTYPGNADLTTRTVEWVRDHGGAPIVNLLENIWYARPPSANPPDPAALPAPAATASAGAPAPLPTLAGSAPLPGEGVWAAGTTATDGAPAAYTTFERPDRQHPSVVAGVAYLDQRHTAVQLIAGTKEPGGVPTPEGAMVPEASRPSLVAVFNSGFKMKDANGGWFADGKAAVPLQQGAASLVVHRDGTATIGQWGRDVVPGPDVTAVRQNLRLIVDGGQPVPGLTTNAAGAWGSAKNQLQYTWRSGVGITRDGGLVYVGGADMNLAVLANALTQAGAVRGMQLDIHDNMVDLFTYTHDGGGLTPQKLLPDMPGPNNRYLVPDQRDFVVVTLR